MAQQTINVGTSPNDGTGTPLRTAFQYTNSNFTELYTAVGPSGNNIVVPGNATITGDLTVDTSTLKVDSANNRVGIGTATPGYPLHVSATDSEIVIQDSNTPVGSNPASLLSFWGSASRAGYIGYPSDNNLYINQVANSSILFLTNNTEQMRLNSTGLGVGASPTAPLHIFSSATGTGPITNVVGTFRVGAAGRDASLQFSDTVNQAYVTMLSGALLFGTGGANERLRIDTSGNVGVGVTPSAWWSGRRAIQIGSSTGDASIAASPGTANFVSLGSNYFVDSTPAAKYIANSTATQYTQLGGQHQWFSAASGTAGTTITDFATAKMVLDASGNLSVGATSALNSVRIFAERSGGSVAGFNRTSSDGTNVLFYRSGSIVGDVSVTTTGTTFNSTSDYRLKESVAPMSGGLARVNALKPSVYKWKSNGSDGEGFLAHELAEVVPAAVNGEKDAVNEDGTIKAQSIDMSRIVPILVAAIKELTAEVNALKNA
jgi:hypothetical protein